MNSWGVSDSLKLYNIENWGDQYFSINPSGNLTVHPKKGEGLGIDLKSVIDEIRAQGVGMPVLIRFQDIIRHRVVAYDVSEPAVQNAEKAGALGARTLDEVAAKLPAPRVVWVMVPSGKITDDTLAALAGKLSKGDIIIDGGNSNYKDSIRHAAEVGQKGVGLRPLVRARLRRVHRG